MKRFVLITIAILYSCSLNAQNRNAIWCFGDSALVDFNDTSNIITGQSIINSRGSSSSICDTAGQLLFYTGYDEDLYSIGGPIYYNGEVFNKLHQTMQNGDSLVMGLWYYEAVIVDNPSNPNIYYIFHTGVTGNFGLYYSAVDMTPNGGLGTVIQKNIQLENFAIVDGMRAIKHGNGRDWWVAIRNATNYGNEHYLYLVSPSGIAPAFIQPVGSINHTNAGRYSFSSDGSKLAFVNYIGLLELYDFDRCTGIINNPVTINPEPSSLPYNYFWGCEFSRNGRFLYVTSHEDTSHVYQYDLQSSNPALTRVTLDSISNYLIGLGDVRLAPDGKIYMSQAYECTAFPFCYPYPDSVYNYVNMNLSVINFPDSLGTACGYAPYSFYLGGKRCYYGLPNNPDYDMSRIIGSPCDTVWAGIPSLPAPKEGELFVTYLSSWDKLFINAQNLKGAKYTLRVYDLLGNLIFKEEGKSQPPYFTKDLSCTAFANGMYVVVLQTEKENLTKKFIKE